MLPDNFGQFRKQLHIIMKNSNILFDNLLLLLKQKQHINKRKLLKVGKQCTLWLRNLWKSWAILFCRFFVINNCLCWWLTITPKVCALLFSLFSRFLSITSASWSAGKFPLIYANISVNMLNIIHPSAEPHLNINTYDPKHVFILVKHLLEITMLHVVMQGNLIKFMVYSIAISYVFECLGMLYLSNCVIYQQMGKDVSNSHL